MKRFIGSITLASIIIITLCAWKNDNSQAEKGMQVWKREERVICQTEPLMVKEARANNGGAAFRVNGGLWLYAGEALKEPVFVCSDTNLVDYCPDGQGGVYYIIRKDTGKDSGIWLKRCTSEGGKEDLFLLDEFLEKGGFLFSRRLRADPEGTIFFCSEYDCLLLDETGRELGRFNRKEASGELPECAGLKSVLVHGFDETGESFSLYDRESGEARKVTGLPDSGHYVCSASEEGDMLISTDSALYGCSDSGETRLLCTWTDWGIVGDDVLAVYRSGDGLHCLADEEGVLTDILFTGDGENEQEGRKTEGNQTEKNRPEKTWLTLGCFGENVWLRRAVAGYNRESEGRISIVDYGTDAREAAEKLEKDIRAGKGPDILAFRGCSEAEERLTNEGMLEELTPYLERGGAVEKADLVEPLYEAQLQEGKLYGMPVTFGIEAIITKEKWAGEEGNWTAAECLESMERAETEAEFLEYGMDRQEWKEKLEDYGCAEADAEARNIYRKIEKYLPKNRVYNPEETVRRQGGMFWESVLISDVESFLYHGSAWGEDARYTGFPGAEGNGMALRPIDCYGINANSRDKEQAWKFIQRYFTEEGRKYTAEDLFSARRDVLDEQFRAAEGHNPEMPVIIYVAGDEVVEVYGAVKEDIDEIKGMMGY